MKISRPAWSSIRLWPLLMVVALIGGCSNEDDMPTGNQFTGWAIPVDDVISGGVPRDGIPSLTSPDMIPGAEATYIQDESLVLGIVVDGQARAYPYPVMDWHEIVNESLTGGRLTISYCPLTGSGIVFDGENSGRSLSFGVSGLLYNNNLILFDRQTNSHWPQMRLRCDQGKLKGTGQIMYPSVETRWSTWLKMFPNTLVLSPITGHSRPYGSDGSAYAGYRQLNSPPMFKVSFNDKRLPPKQKVHGVIVGQESRAYPLSELGASSLLNHTLNGDKILVVGDASQFFARSFSRMHNGQELTFSHIGSDRTFPFHFTDDQTHSVWNVMCEAIGGPLAGQRLEPTVSFNAYWFAWGAFFRDAEIYEN